MRTFEQEIEIATKEVRNTIRFFRREFAQGRSARPDADMIVRGNDKYSGAWVDIPTDLSLSESVIKAIAEIELARPE